MFIVDNEDIWVISVIVPNVCIHHEIVGPSGCKYMLDKLRKQEFTLCRIFQYRENVETPN